MGIYVLTGIVLVAVVAALSVAVLKERASKNIQAQAASPSYTDENGGEYIAAFLKGMTDSTTTDAAEFQKYIGTYEDSQPGMPLFFQIEDGVVKIILEKQIA